MACAIFQAEVHTTFHVGPLLCSGARTQHKRICALSPTPARLLHTPTLGIHQTDNSTPLHLTPTPVWCRVVEFVECRLSVEKGVDSTPPVAATVIWACAPNPKPPHRFGSSGFFRACEKLRLPGVVHGFRKIDVMIPGKENSNSHGARPVHLIKSRLHSGFGTVGCQQRTLCARQEKHLHHTRSRSLRV